MVHSIPIRESDDVGMIRKILGSSKSDIPRSKVADAIAKLKAAGIDAKVVNKDGQDVLEFSYGVGAGYPGSRIDESGERVGDVLPEELKKIIDEALYSEVESGNYPEDVGSQIRSKGKGRGLGIGKAKGPLGLPIGEKTAFDWNRLGYSPPVEKEFDYNPEMAGYFRGYFTRGK